jgi:two-component system, LuxR family, response regulator FixJ
MSSVITRKVEKSEENRPANMKTALPLIFIVDDNDAFRDSTRWLLESYGYIVDAYSNPKHFLASLDAGAVAVDFACLLLDMRMPEMTGLEVMDEVYARSPNLPIVFISGHGDVPLAVEAMRKGAQNFLEKPFIDDALDAAIQSACKAAVTRQSSVIDEVARHRLQSLTVREKQVLELVVQGKLNKVIADILGISIKTVELHRLHVMQKMQAKSLAHLVQLNMKAGNL